MSELPRVARVDVFDNVRAGPIDEFLAMTQGGTSLDEARFLYGLACRVTSGCILEIGSYRGRSTVALARASIDGSRVPVYAIDPHETFTGILGGKFGPRDRGAFMKAMVDTDAYHVVRLINLRSEEVAQIWREKISLLWIDGDHRYEAVRRDWDLWSPHLARDAMIIFDDANDPRIGPSRLIAEIAAEGVFAVIEEFGKISMLRQVASVAG